MGKTIVMNWLRDGRVRLSKNAPPALQDLAKSGLLDQADLSSVFGLPRTKNALALKFKKAPEGLNANNLYGVEKDQIWESLDPRHNSYRGERRQVRIVEVGAEHALVQGLRFDTKSLIKLSRFNGRTTRSYRRVMPRLVAVQAEA